MSLPLIRTNDRVLSQIQTTWSSALNPVLANQLVNGNFIQNVTLSGTSPTVINHKLSRNQLGWFIVDQNGPSTIYRSQPLNDLTLTLTSSANCVISLWVF